MTLVLFIVILSILVFVHELGHFLAAKKAGILVEEFGFGLPPRLWGKKIGETTYSINCLPIGGFVKLYGEDGATFAEASASQGRAYYEKSILRRLSVLLAGVTMNVLLAIICFSILYFVSGIPTKTGIVKVVAMAENSPASLAQMKIDDIIVSLDDKKVVSVNEFVNLTKEKAGEKISLEIKRGDKNLVLQMVPRMSPPEGEGPLGVAISDMEMKKYPWWQMPYFGMIEGFKESWSWGGMIVKSLKETLSSIIVQGKVPRDIAGPIGIFQVTGQVAKAGWLAVIQLLGILSVNLAIMNILPLPALDGGRVVFLAYELVFRKKANQKVEAIVNNVGMAMLLALMVLITVNDILRIIGR